MGSNKNVVISFSIAILLLLSLLLLLTYNSKCSSNNKMQMNYMDKSQNIPTGFSNDNEKYYNFERFTPPSEDYIKLQQQAYQASQAQQTSQAPSQQSQQTSSQSLSSPQYVGGYNSFRPDPELASSGIGNYSPSNPEYNSSQMLDTQQSDSYDINSQFATSSSGGAASQSGAQSCFPRDRLTASDLLPKDAADSKWARINPSGAGDIHDQNYLTAGFHVGVNTVGQSLRNANLQLRSEIPNPQNAVGPWMISTIEPDFRQNTLEIGSSPAY
jgi:hypothetical protein